MSDQKDQFVHVIVPDEAIEAGAQVIEPDAWKLMGKMAEAVRNTHRRHAREVLAAAAPAIVAANQPKPNDDLSNALEDVIEQGLDYYGTWVEGGPHEVTSKLLPAVEAFVAAQVAAARAKALHDAWLAVHVIRFDGRHGNADGPDNFYNGIQKAEQAIEDLGVNVRHAQEETDRG